MSNIKKVNMKIGIIGVGAIGGTLAKHFAKQGHSVSVANSRGVETLKDFATKNNVKAVSVHEAARENEIVIISIPQLKVLDLPKDLFNGVSEEVLVVDTGNYYPLLRDGIYEDLEGDLTNSEWVSKIIGRPVIKVFNSIGATSLLNKGSNENAPERIALAVAGDKANHKEVVRDLLNQIGFDYYDNGLLKDSWKQEPGTPGYCLDYTVPQLKEAMESLGKERTLEIREQIKAQRTEQELSIIQKTPEH